MKLASTLMAVLALSSPVAHADQMQKLVCEFGIHYLEVPNTRVSFFVADESIVRDVKSGTVTVMRSITECEDSTEVVFVAKDFDQLMSRSVAQIEGKLLHEESDATLNVRVLCRLVP
jgi:uncharacterized protein YbaA (DUF1428 family)